MPQNIPSRVEQASAEECLRWLVQYGLGTGGTPASGSQSSYEYESVLAGQNLQPLGAAGARGDFFAGMLIIPGTTSPGAVTIRDGPSGTDITIFAGGASSVSNLVPFYAPINSIGLGTGGWLVTTGTNVSILANGNFS